MLLKDLDEDDIIRLMVAVFHSDDDWASKPRSVYSGEAMERELDELFPVKVGVQAIRDRNNEH